MTTRTRSITPTGAGHMTIPEIIDRLKQINREQSPGSAQHETADLLQQLSDLFVDLTMLDDPPETAV